MATQLPHSIKFRCPSKTEGRMGDPPTYLPMKSSPFLFSGKRCLIIRAIFTSEGYPKATLNVMANPNHPFCYNGHKHTAISWGVVSVNQPSFGSWYSCRFQVALKGQELQWILTTPISNRRSNFPSNRCDSLPSSNWDCCFSDILKNCFIVTSKLPAAYTDPHGLFLFLSSMSSIFPLNIVGSLFHRRPIEIK